MRIALLAFLFMSHASAQVFLEDISKIQHRLAENEVESYLKNPNQTPLPEIYFNALMPVESFDPFTMCPIPTDNYKPEELKYRVLLVTEDAEVQSPEEAKITVVLEQLEFKEQDSEFVQKVKEFVGEEGSNPGRLTLTERKQKGKQLIHYSANGLSVNMNTNLSSTNNLGINVQSEDIAAATVTVDFVNRLNVTQTITPGTSIKGSVESFKSTGTRDITELEGTGVAVDRVKAELKLDSKIGDKVSTYTGVTYRDENSIEEIKTMAGLNLTLPNENRIIVFTGTTSTNSPQLQSRSRDYNIEFATRRNFKLYGKIQDREREGRYYEAGFSVDLYQ